MAALQAERNAAAADVRDASASAAAAAAAEAAEAANAAGELHERITARQRWLDDKRAALEAAAAEAAAPAAAAAAAAADALAALRGEVDHLRCGPASDRPLPPASSIILPHGLFGAAVLKERLVQGKALFGQCRVRRCGSPVQGVAPCAEQQHRSQTPDFTLHGLAGRRWQQRRWNWGALRPTWPQSTHAQQKRPQAPPKRANN